MMRMVRRRRRLCLACVTTRALPIVKATGELGAVDVPVLLRMRIVTIRASHAAVQVTIAILLVLLIGERAHAAIGIQWPIAQQRQRQRIESLERIAARITGVKPILDGMALEAHTE